MEIDKIKESSSLLGQDSKDKILELQDEGQESMVDHVESFG